MRDKKGHGLGHMTYFYILGPLHISEMGKATDFKFGVWIAPRPVSQKRQK